MRRYYFGSMDSLTQFTLGAALGVVTLGRKIGPRKAAITGGVLATLPDLDVIVRHANPIDNFILHRGATHSLIVHTLVAPLFGEGLRLLFKDLRDQRWRAIAAVWLIFTTHALIDAVTVYGTKLLWPITDYPFGPGTNFIIDPFYTIPLLIPVLWALFIGQTRHPDGAVRVSKVGTVASAMLVVSTLYLGWSFLAQDIARSKIETILKAEGITAERLLVTPMPFSTILWRGVAIDEDRYINVYSSLFDDDEAGDGQVHAHDRNLSLRDAMDDTTSVDRIAEFSKGFFSLVRVGNEVFVQDLRMGVAPDYAFTFKVAKVGTAYDATKVVAVRPVRMQSGRSNEGDIAWLYERLFDQTAIRAEGSIPQFVGGG